MKRFVHLFLASLAFLMMSGCERLPSVNSLVITTPDAGNLTFSTHVFADDGSGQYDVIAFTGGKKVNDFITLVFLFDKKTGVGWKFRRKVTPLRSYESDPLCPFRI